MYRQVALLAFILMAASNPAKGDTGCPMPFAFIDRWQDTNGNSMYDEGEPYDPALTGYHAPDDVGAQLSLAAANPAAAQSPDEYWVVALPPLWSDPAPLTGETWLRKWVSECAPYGVSAGDSLLLEPGRLFSALLEELDNLIAADPDAHWDEGTQSVEGSAFETSPRLVAVAAYDPTLPPAASRNFVRVGQIAIIFLESTAASSTINVRFVGSTQTTVATEPTSWGRMKSIYREQP
jgi:hypothetical protein